MEIWNIILSVIVAAMGFLLRDKFEELNRLAILLNKTREEIAREHITRKEVRDDIEKIMERFDAGFERLEAKIDALQRNKHGGAHESSRG
jgi:hypothetical protein